MSDVNADEVLCTEQSDCFKMSCLGPSSPQSPASHSNIRWACRLIKRLSDRGLCVIADGGVTCSLFVSRQNQHTWGCSSCGKIRISVELMGSGS